MEIIYLKEVVETLNNFKTREEAGRYFTKKNFTSETLRLIAKHYSVPNLYKKNKAELTEKLIETTVGAKLRFAAIYNTKVRA